MSHLLNLINQLGDGFLDALILWRNERERAQPLKPLMDAFELKAAAVLAQLDREAAALASEAFAKAANGAAPKKVVVVPGRLVNVVV